MSHVEKVVALLSRSVVFLSTTLSVVTVLGLAALPVPPGGGEALQAEPPKPAVWSDAEMIAGLRECVKLLAPINADVEISEPVRHETCGAPAPVLLRRVGSGANSVEINPPVVLNCAMVARLHAWVQKTLQPVARETLGSPITRLRNVSGYACRARNGHQLGTDKLSEHALANAIDIPGFITADGRTIDVAQAWGPTLRDQREAEKVAVAQAKEPMKEPVKRDDGKAEPVEDKLAMKKMSAIANKSAPRPDHEMQDARSVRTTVVSANPKAVPVTTAADQEDPKKNANADFLHRLHKGACGVFGTVLGPEANELHRDHLHFDLAQRSRSALCH
jgi:hypothetical protein